MSDVTVTLTAEEAWLVYDLLIGRGDPLMAKQEEAMTNLGADHYLRPAKKIRDALHCFPADPEVRR